MSSFTQIPLDFGPEQQVPSSPVPTDREGVEEPARTYMAASGVGVRIKSYKQSASAAHATGDLFGPAAPGAPTTGPAATVEMPVRSTEIQADPEIAPSAEIAEAAATIAVAREPTDKIEEPVSRETASAVEMRATVPVERTVPATDKARGRATTHPSKAGKRASNERNTVKAASKRGRKSLKQVSAEADLIEIPEDEVLFGKQYYTMGEVSEMFRVNQSLLRFWEAEFDILQPRKNKKGDRYFRPVDIKNLHLIYHLLRQRKYTIEGAKEFLKKNKKAEERFEVIQRLQQIKGFLLEWKAQL
jgi:DNA-binding transcriptional MerR regulator